tara:strand:- start:123 stop:473 length:351 start_codon:yes stop_codon:yes gene_type:complete
VCLCTVSSCSITGQAARYKAGNAIQQEFAINTDIFIAEQNVSEPTEPSELSEQPLCIPVVQRPAITSNIRRYTPSSDRNGAPPAQAVASATEANKAGKPSPGHQHRLEEPSGFKGA